MKPERLLKVRVGQLALHGIADWAGLWSSIFSNVEITAAQAFAVLLVSAVSLIAIG